jgi:hypothetical protein
MGEQKNPGAQRLRRRQTFKVPLMIFAPASGTAKEIWAVGAKEI